MLAAACIYIHLEIMSIVEANKTNLSISIQILNFLYTARCRGSGFPHYAVINLKWKCLSASQYEKNLKVPY